MDKLQLLQKTADIIKQRGKDYGSILDNHTRISRLWSVLLDTNVTPEQVALCMIAVKQARLMETPDHVDSVQDILGYALTYYECANAKK
tara:strand:- start:58 stop:324 length:267 start_codon:yes stop_codon:yes gene_type:complete